MESKEGLKIIKEKEKMISFFKEQRSKSIKTNLGNLGVIENAKQESKIIYDKFNRGCREVFGKTTLNHCVAGLLCSNCREIKKIQFAILGVNE